MKPISAALLAHLQGQVITTCTLWLVTLINGAIKGFTDHDKDVAYGGVTFLANSGFTRSAIQDTSSLGVDNMEVQGLLISPSITEDALMSGTWDYAKVDFYVVNWADLTMGSLYLRTGRLGQVSKLRESFTAELRGLTQLLAQNIGEIYSPACRADLGDSRCTVDLTSFTVIGTVGSVTSNRIINDGGLTQADGWFDHGKLTFTSGLNNGLAMEVKSYTVGQIQLSMQLYYAITTGDTYSVHAGCKKDRPTCRDKFNNIINMRAEPDLPGLDLITQVVPQ